MRPVSINIYIATVLIGLSLNTLKAQDAPMSQFYSNLVVLNPAFAGMTANDRINLFYRNQWIKSDAGFQSFGVAYDKNFANYNSGIGVIVTNEINGVFMAPTVDFAYSYKLEPFKGMYLGLGLQAGIAQKYFRTSDLVFQDALGSGVSGENISTGFSKIVPDFSLGLVGFYKNYYGGLSIDHIAQPYQGETKDESVRLNRKYTGFIGYLYYFNTRLLKQERVLSPNLLVQIQGHQQNINWGFSFQYNSLIGGLWLRHNLQANFDALIFSVGFKTQQYKFAYSYDMNVGKKSTIPLGAHEVSLTMLFETHKKKKYKPMKCPTFLQ